jgi:hypothetical protein
MSIPGKSSSWSVTEDINAMLIRAGHPEECVYYICPDHSRHCVHLGAAHDRHECMICSLSFSESEEEEE